MKLKDILTRDQNRKKRSTHSCRINHCNQCGEPIPKGIVFTLEDLGLCRICTHKSQKVKHAICTSCLVSKPLTDSHFYPKVRGVGHMRVCRTCRDKQLYTRNKRICGGCWDIYLSIRFSEDEWNKPIHDLAFCLSCTEHRKHRIAKPVMNEKVCPRCNKSKPFSEYYVLATRQASYCKACTKEYNRLRSKHWRGIEPCRRLNRSQTVENIHALQSNFTEQELVDMWAEGEDPHAKNNGPLAKESKHEDQGAKKTKEKNASKAKKKIKLKLKF